MSNYDFIIVGQGLAGSLLGFQLIQQQKSVLVIDNQHHASASIVAAGIINPITGHRVNLTENFASFYQTATAFYAELEQLFKQTFFAPVSQYRLLKTKEQYEYWRKRTEQDTHTPYLGEYYQQRDEFTTQDFGCVEIKQSASVSVNVLLHVMKQWLIEHNAYQAHKLDYQQININDNKISIGKLNTKKLIFCEGYQAINNPWLQHLPFKLAKGEILTLEIPELAANMLNWGNWLMPTGSNNFKLGANFEWNKLQMEPSSEIKTNLLANMAEYLAVTGHVTNHQAGIRPTTAQRQPFIGAINKHKNLFCFNGFGSKGCLIIPHYAQLFTAHLLQNQPLPDDVTKWL